MREALKAVDVLGKPCLSELEWRPQVKKMLRHTRVIASSLTHYGKDKIEMVFQ
jgi:hypothetical protein